MHTHAFTVCLRLEMSLAYKLHLFIIVYKMPRNTILKRQTWRELDKDASSPIVSWNAVATALAPYARSVISPRSTFLYYSYKLLLHTTRCEHDAHNTVKWIHHTMSWTGGRQIHMDVVTRVTPKVGCS